MIPPRFEYQAVSSVDEAIRALDQYQGDAKILAGGHSLIPMMKLRLTEPKALIDINGIPDLAFIREDGDWLRIGALARTNDLLDSPLLRKSYPIFSDAASEIADPIVRNWGTVGGNLSHGDVGNDLPAVMMALNAQFVVRGPGGKSRTVPATGFYKDTFVTVLAPNELLTEAQVPKARPGDGSAYLKIEKRVGDFAIAGAAAFVGLGAKGTVERAGIALTAAGPTAIRVQAAEAELVGKSPDEAALTRAATAARAAAKPASDIRGPSDYKVAVAGELVRRALRRSVERARGGK